MTDKSNNRPFYTRVFEYFFINRTFAIVLALAIVVAGVVGYRSMIKESLPDLEVPQALIVTAWPGAAPELMEKEVTNIIERALRDIDGLKRLRSGSMESVSVVSVEFRADADMADSMTKLRRAVANAEPELPKKAEKPSIEQISVRDIPICTLAISGCVDTGVMHKAAKLLKRHLERTSGVRKVSLFGHRREILQVRLDRHRLRGFGISPSLVLSRLETTNVDAPLGRFENADYPFDMAFYGGWRDVETLRMMPVKRMPQGRLIRLGDIAVVEAGPARESTRTSVSWNKEPFMQCVALSVYKTPGRDTIDLVRQTEKAVRQTLSSPQWPSDLTCRVVSDDSELILDEVNKALSNGWQSMMLVFVVLFFLLSWREALVAALSIPLTFLGVMLVLWAMGYTFNVLVIIGLVLAMGLLVDDFILMMEGLHDGLFLEGLGFADAARRAIRLFAVPSLSGSITTILVFLPLAFISGLDGKFIRIIPVTAAVCLVLSYVISILIDIPLSSGLLTRKKAGASGKSRIDRITEKISERVAGWLERKPLKSRWRAMGWVAAGLVLFVISLAAAFSMPSELYPKEDSRELGITVELPADSNLDYSARVGERVAKVLRAKPYFTNVMQVVGQKDAYLLGTIGELLTNSDDPYYTGFTCTLTPSKKRVEPVFVISERLRHELKNALADVPGARIIMTPQLGGSTAEDPIQIELIGDDMNRLREISQHVQKALQSISGAVDIRDNLGQLQLEASLTPRREAMDFYKIREDDLSLQLRILTTMERSGRFRMDGIKDDLKIHVGTLYSDGRASADGPVNWEELERLAVVNEIDNIVPLSNLVDWEYKQKAAVIIHREGMRAVTVKARTHGVTPGEIIEQLEPGLERMKADWPVGFDYIVAGEKEAGAETFSSVNRVFILAVAAVFAILVLLFDSFRQPVIILFAVLLGLIGVFGGFFLINMPLSFTAAIGIVALVGINVNDAIVMITTMNTHRKNGLSLKQSAARGAADRLRPIVSTTITTVIGLIPLALADAAWKPLCLAVIFGELASTALSITLVPCLFLVLTPGNTEYVGCRHETLIPENG
jgi:multidrug efflux pump subunit AcrB